MLISHAHRFIFIKTVKTAGTSVECFFERFCAPPDHVVSHYTSTIISSEGVIGRRGPSSSRHDNGYYNHMTAGEIESLFPEFYAYKKFSVVRNPYDRAVSWFHFCGAKAISPYALTLSEAESLYAFGDISTLRHHFLEFIAAKGLPDDESYLTINGKLAIDRCLRFEHLASDISHLLSEWSIPSPLGGVASALPRYKVIRQSESPPVDAYLGKTAINLINEKNSFTFANFGYEQINSLYLSD